MSQQLHYNQSETKKGKYSFHVPLQKLNGRKKHSKDFYKNSSKNEEEECSQKE